MLKSATVPRQLWVQTMPEYGGTLPKLIASHGRPLSAKSGVWEDTRMLKFASGGCASGGGLVGDMCLQYNFARVTDIATVLKSLLDSSIPRQFLDMLDSF